MAVTEGVKERAAQLKEDEQRGFEQAGLTSPDVLPGEQAPSKTTTVIPEGAEPIERSGRGNVTVFQKGGERFFTPEATSHKQGFRTESERIAAQQVGATMGPHSGRLVRKDSIAITAGPGSKKIIGRITQKRFEKGIDIDPSRLIFPKVKAKPSRSAKVSQAAAAFEAQQADKRFNKLNTKLPDGVFVSNADLVDMKKENPKAYKVFKASGFSAGNKEIARQNVSLIAAPGAGKSADTLETVAAAKTTPSAIKAVWRMLTPWNESGGQTYLEYMKKYPDRLKTTLLTNLKGGVTESQAVLKQQHDSYQAAPLWAKALFAKEVNYNSRTKRYERILLTVSPEVRSKAPVIKVAVKDRVDWDKIIQPIIKGKVKSAEQAAKWAKIEGAVDKARTALSKEKSIARTKSFLKAREAAVAGQKKAQAATVAKNAEQQQFLKTLLKKSTVQNKDVAAANKAIAAKLAAIKNTPAPKRAALPKLTLTLSQLALIRTLTSTETVTEVQQLQQELTKTQTATKLQELTKALEKLQEQVQTETETKTATALALSTALATETETATQQQLQTAVQEMLQEFTSLKEKTQVQEQLKEKVQPVTETRLDTIKETTPGKPGDPIEPTEPPPGTPSPPGTPPPKKPPPKTPPPKPTITSGAGGKKKELTKKDIESAIAWKDGFVVHAIISPYRRGIDEHTFHVDNLPPGLKVMPSLKGKGSQQRSVKIKGSLKRTVTVDVGNQDVIISPAGRGRATLQHRRDTTGTISGTTIKKGKSISRKKGRLFETKTGGSTVLSRRPLRGM